MVAQPTTGQEAAAGSLRILGNDDLDEVMALLMASPLENVFVASRVENAGLDPFMLGCQVVGYERDRQLVSLCHAGSNLVPVNADDEALQAYIRYLGPRRRAASIMGVAEPTIRLWEGLSQSYGGQWSEVRDLRPEQPLMSISEDSQLPADPRVERITMKDFDAYFEAAVKMYTEEVGVNPLEATGSYRNHVRRTIQQGRAFGILEKGRVLFKSDVGCATGMFCQVQGVWMDPALRGQGLSGPAMAAVVRFCRERWPVVSLYVNDYNTPAIKLYERVGFATIGRFATVLY
ncbi:MULTISPECIES: GNAT family N-acetyltransferase [unclassified Luteococcus]|uniref:GNAT family N-acetyltransferase n=1 Tax=unclassified Luteococcus TaxID=2639923 RepID=UPI00313AD7D4